MFTKLGVSFRERVYTPIIIVWMFLSQVHSADDACRETVSRLLARQQRLTCAAFPLGVPTGQSTAAIRSVSSPKRL